MIEFIRNLFLPQEGTSWLALDDQMRAKIRSWGCLGVLLVGGLMITSLYAIVKWPPLTELLDSVAGRVQHSIKTKEELPPWLVTLSAVGFVFLTASTLTFLGFLVDFGKIHYKIDAVTGHLRDTVDARIIQVLIDGLNCPREAACSLRIAASTTKGRREIMKSMFYEFANREQVGSFNQKDKRQQVFRFWREYYTFNFFMTLVLFSCAWISCLLFVQNVTWWAIIVGAAAGGGLLAWAWRGRNRYYRAGALGLAEDQVRAFLQQARVEVVQQAHRSMETCSAKGCPVRSSSIQY